MSRLSKGQVAEPLGRLYGCIRNLLVLFEYGQDSLASTLVDPHLELQVAKKSY